ncbi:hypothetical protein EDD15DRAFT_2179883, partial [Pisolithus albus]
HQLLQLQSYLPQEYDILMELADAILKGYQPPALPFLSLTVNMNIHTEAHQDLMDKSICLVIPIGDFKQVPLVLVEQGLVLGSAMVMWWYSGQVNLHIFI